MILPEGDGDEALPPETYGDFGFHYPLAYVELVVGILQLSNWSAWPQAGGIDNQDMYLIEDVRRYLRLSERVRWEIKTLGGIQYPDEFLPGESDQMVKIKMNA